MQPDTPQPRTRAGSGISNGSRSPFSFLAFRPACLGCDLTLDIRVGRNLFRLAQILPTLPGPGQDCLHHRDTAATRYTHATAACNELMVNGAAFAACKAYSLADAARPIYLHITLMDTVSGEERSRARMREHARWCSNAYAKPEPSKNILHRSFANTRLQHGSRPSFASPHPPPSYSFSYTLRWSCHGPQREPTLKIASCNPTHTPSLLP